MKQLLHQAGRVASVAALAVCVALLSGCETSADYSKVPETNVRDNTVGIHNVDKFRVSDPVSIRFSGPSGESPVIPEYTETIKEDGTITPPMIGTIVAVNKTPGDLQHELQEKYSKLYRNLTVTLISPSRYYYVSGEVRKPGPELYLGETDIVKAISAAGDFTDFANKGKVRLTRANGQTEVVNVKRILDDPQYDVPIFPGDKIYVPRRYW